jgi:uncharacterized protein YigE (DUF2233 family)
MLSLVVTLLLSAPIAGQDDARFFTFVAEPAEISLHWRDAKKQHYGSLGAVVSALERQGKKPVFAMNGGMYMEDRRPVGLYVEDGVQLAKLSRHKSDGNFGWLPNGVFVLRDDGTAAVVETSRYTSDHVRAATQSGPMLLIEGVMHEGFTEDSKFTATRNGVGVLPDGRVVFVMSKQPVTFHAFATYFQALGCRHALYLDGNVSRLWWPAGGARDTGGDFGVIITVAR